MQFLAVKNSTTVGKIKAENQDRKQTIFPVVDSEEHYLGLLYLDDLKDAPLDKTAGDVLKSVQEAGEHRNIYVYSKDSVDNAKALMHQKGLLFLPIVDYTHHFLGTVDSSST